MLEFAKVHGAGNDFILLPDPDDRLELTATLTSALCDRHRGIGGDGVIRLGAPRNGTGADVFMDYRNADGSVSEMCGNGVRTVAKYVADAQPETSEVAVDTRAGTKTVVCHRGTDGLVQTCTVDMGAPVVIDTDVLLDLSDQTTQPVTTISMGNPHAVLFVDDVATAPVADLGPRIEHHPAFPDGTNVEFIRVVDRGTVRGRIWERGVGETLASGTGGAAMAVAAIAAGLADAQVAVRLPGGVLRVEWTDTTLFVTGPAVEVVRGVIDSARLVTSEEEMVKVMAHDG